MPLHSPDAPTFNRVGPSLQGDLSASTAESVASTEERGSSHRFGRCRV